MDKILKSITVYYCSSPDNFIYDISTITYSQLKELLSYNGDMYACLKFNELTTHDKNVYEKSEWVTGNDKYYLEKLYKFFDCDSIKELEMMVKLKRK